MPEEIVYTVYFNGTGHTANEIGNLAGYLYENTIAATSYAADAENPQLKRGMDGTQITNGVSGFLFGTGSHHQCRQIYQDVVNLIRQGKKVILNCYGHSRGGIEVFLLIKMLDIDKNLLEINLAVLEPTPGNFLTTVALDSFDQTLANQAMDLSDCHNLNKVLLLYTNKPASFISALAPLIPTLPKTCEVEKDVVFGMHSEPQGIGNSSEEFVYVREESLSVLVRVRNFLESCGTNLHPIEEVRYFKKRNNEIKTKNIDELRKAFYKKQMESLNKNVKKSFHGAQAGNIETHSYDETKTQFLNLDHQRLCTGENNPNKIEETDETDTKHQNGLDTDYHSPYTKQLFQNFVEQILAAMSEQSKKSAKGAIFQNYLDQLKSKANFENKEELKNALRNILAIALQKDRHLGSVFFNTRSGEKALELLRSNEFILFSQLIPTTSTARIIRIALTSPLARNIPDSPRDQALGYKELRLVGYDDLCNFVGAPSQLYFRSPNNCRLEMTKQSFSLFVDHTPFYMRERIIRVNHKEYRKERDQWITTTIPNITSYPKKYERIFAAQFYQMDKVLMLLGDYGGNNAWDSFKTISRFFHGHWGNHHGAVIAKSIQEQYFKMYLRRDDFPVYASDKDLHEVIKLLEKIEKDLRDAGQPLNPNGELVKRLKFIQENIKDENGNPNPLNTIDLVKLCCDLDNKQITYSFNPAL